MCGKKRHTKTEIRSEMSDLICGRIAAGENYNLTRDSDRISHKPLWAAEAGLLAAGQSPGFEVCNTGFGLWIKSLLLLFYFPPKIGYTKIKTYFFRHVRTVFR